MNAGVVLELPVKEPFMGVILNCTVFNGSASSALDIHPRPAGDGGDLGGGQRHASTCLPLPSSGVSTSVNG